MISDNYKPILKIVCLVSVFLFVAINVIAHSSAIEKDDDGEQQIYKEYCESSGGKMINGCEYDFVYCPNDSNIYPQGTDCNIEAAEQRDEKEHEEESEEWNEDDVDEEEEEAMNK